MTYHVKRHGQRDNKNWSEYVMLRQEMESYPIIIKACAHNKDDNKQSKYT